MGDTITFTLEVEQAANVRAALWTRAIHDVNNFPTFLPLARILDDQYYEQVSSIVEELTAELRSWKGEGINE